MRIKKHFVGDHMWTIQDAELDPNAKLPIKDVYELIELYNKIMKELADEGILNIGSH
ncbi:MAG: hypothetical protein PHW62_00830 [Candidatus Ratteibacteria bacterium]|nr:hypothetical protein [Candidatus Ratteibacteria bacterium]